MEPSRREFLAAGGAAAAMSFAPRALAQWQPSQRYPCFGGICRNRLFLCASTSLFSLYVNVQGAL